MPVSPKEAVLFPFIGTEVGVSSSFSLIDKTIQPIVQVHSDIRMGCFDAWPATNRQNGDFDFQTFRFERKIVAQEIL
jgi:hypothetical protein